MELAQLKNLKVGFVGAGNMAQAIGSAFIDSGVINPQNMMVSAPSERNLKYWKDRNVKTTHENGDIVSFGHIVFLAVKPQYFNDMIESLKKSQLNVAKNICFVTIMVGKTVKMVQDILNSIPAIREANCHFVKVMPNTPSEVKAGCSVMSYDEVGKYTLVVRDLMKLTGICELIPESIMDACGALSGSGPAYLYMVIEAMADGGVKLGIPRALAYKLAAQAMVGAGKMVLETGKHPGSLKDEVCSPGGSTIVAVHELEKGGVRAAFISALTGAAEKSAQLRK